MIWICIGIVVIFLVLYLVLQIQVKGKLMAYFQNGNYAAFEKCLNQTLTKIVIPAYNIEFIRLNALISQKRKKEVERQLDKLFKAKNRTISYLLCIKQLCHIMLNKKIQGNVIPY